MCRQPNRPRISRGFVIGQPDLPGLNPDNSVDLTATQEALTEGYTVDIWFSEDLSFWQPASEGLLIGVTSEGPQINPQGDRAQTFDLAPWLQKLFWKIQVTEP